MDLARFETRLVRAARSLQPRIVVGPKMLYLRERALRLDAFGLPLAYLRQKTAQDYLRIDVPQPWKLRGSPLTSVTPGTWVIFVRSRFDVARAAYLLAGAVEDGTC